MGSKLAIEESTEETVLEWIGNTERLSRDMGLGIVREACNELEYQARTLCEGEPVETTRAGTDRK